MERPLIAAVIAFIAGIAVATVVTIPDTGLLIGLSFTLAALLLFIHRKTPFPAFAALMIVFFISGILDMNVYRYHEPPKNHIVQYAGRELLTMEGVISECPQASPDKTDLSVSVHAVLTIDPYCRHKVKGKVLLSVKPDLPLKYGDVIRFKTRLTIPHNFNNPGGFDYAGYLRDRGFLVRGFITDAAHIVVIREGYGNPLLLMLEDFRSRIRQLIRDHAPMPVSAVIQASILGNQKEIPKGIMDQFNLTGTSHIIAISGFNMGIVALFAIFISRMVMKSFPRLLLRFNWQRVSAVSAAIFVVIYTFIAGAGISVIRATLMILVLMLAILLGKIRDAGNTLAMAALAILTVSPYDLFDISFQLSFSAVMALLIITPRLTRLIPPPDRYSSPISYTKRLLHRGIRTILIFFTVTLSATIGTLPLILFYFNRLSTIVFLSNLLVVPILGIMAIPVCMLIILFAPFSETLAVLFIKIAGFLVKVSLMIVEYLAALPYAAVWVSTPDLWEIVAYYLFIFILLKISDEWWKNRAAVSEAPPHPVPPDVMKRGRRHFLTLSGALILVTAFLAGHFFYVHDKDRNTGLLKMTVLDVGQGSSVLIRFPGEKIMLVDGGGFYDNTFDIGKYVLAPYLRYERISRVDVVVLTHPHPDHLNGLIYILENFPVGEVWTNEDLNESDIGKAFLRLIAEKKIRQRQVSRRSGPIDIEGVRIRLLNRPNESGGDEDGLSFDDINDNALIMRLTYKKVSFLLPSDISSGVEERLLRSKHDLKSQVLLVPHHGSRHSSSVALLESVAPSWAILSVGKDNFFRLPHPDTLARYDSCHIPIYRTDRHGAVTVSTDGDGMDIESYLVSR